MILSLANLLLSLGVATPTAYTCPVLNFVGDVRQFVVEQENGKNRRTVPAVERAMTAADFYNYSSYSSHTGLEEAETSFMLLYRDLDQPDELSFFWIHGIDEGAKEGQRQVRASVNGLITGVPEGVTIVQRDDRVAEWDWTSSTTLGGEPTHEGKNLGGSWTFNKNTDGGAVSGLPMDKDWELRIDANFSEGINKWFFYFGDGSSPQLLDPSEPVFLHPVVTTVDLGVAPYPEVAGPQTFCTLVASESGSREELTFTFKWGDGTPNTVVTKKTGELACAEHHFCGPVSPSCGGTAPRRVRVHAVAPGCQDGVGKVLAKERVEHHECDYMYGPSVEINGVPLEGMPLGGSSAYYGRSRRISQIPENLRETAVYAPEGDVEEGSELVLYCCGDDVCEFVVTHYHCPPCSSGTNGGFPDILPGCGFEPSPCAPKYGETEENMVSYRMQVMPNQAVRLPPTKSVASSFVVLAQSGAFPDSWCPKTKYGCNGPCVPSVCRCI